MFGRCRLVVAAPREDAGRDDPARWSHVRIATKYPEMTRRHFAQRGVRRNASCSTARWSWRRAWGWPADRRSRADRLTLRANGLVEIEHIADITSRFIVNRAALKTRAEEVNGWIERFREAADAA